MNGERRSASELWDELERLAEAAELKAEISSFEAKVRFSTELLPKLAEARKAVDATTSKDAALRSSIARNVLEDTIVLCREFLLTAGARVVAPVDREE